MSRSRFLRLTLLPLLAGVATPVVAQQDPIGTTQIQPVAPPSAAAPVPIAVPPPVVAPIMVQWPERSARALLDYIALVGRDGLDPGDYGSDRLTAAIAAANPQEISAAATQSFLKLSSDLALGHVRGDDRVDWHVNDQDLNGNEQYAMMQRVAQDGEVAAALDGLLPAHPQYQELKSVLAQTTDPDTIEKIRTNMDRWRWLPRDLGRKYVIVNVPAYSVALVENGQVTARRRAVAGAIKTATPQLSAVISGAIFNPWWEVPASISPEVRGKKGYVAVDNGQGGKRYRQPPGPSNALGRMKLVMSNPYAIYLHDTNAKGLFDTKMRAYSHGCIRTEDAIGFAATLLENTPEWDRARIDEVVASGKTVQANLAEPIPVYITYFTAAAVSAKNEIIAYSDIYKRDKPVAMALNDRGGEATTLASRAE